MTEAPMKNFNVRLATAKDNAYIKQMLLDVLDEYDIEAALAYDDFDAIEFRLNERRDDFVSEIDGQAIGSAGYVPPRITAARRAG